MLVRNHRAEAPLLQLTTTNLGSNLWIGNHPGANGLYTGMLPGRGNAEFEQEDARRIAEEAAGRQLDAGQVGHEGGWYQTGKEGQRPTDFN